MSSKIVDRCSDVLDIFLLVSLRNGNICTPSFQFDGYQFAKAVLDGGECLIDDVGDVVLPEGVTMKSMTRQ